MSRPLCRYLVAAVSPNLDAAAALYPTYVSTLVFFAGFIIRPDVRAAQQWGRCMAPRPSPL